MSRLRRFIELLRDNQHIRQRAGTIRWVLGCWFHSAPFEPENKNDNE